MVKDRAGRYVISVDVIITEREAEHIRTLFAEWIASDPRPIVLGYGAHVWDTIAGRYICHPDSESHRVER